MQLELCWAMAGIAELLGFSDNINVYGKDIVIIISIEYNL